MKRHRRIRFTIHINKNCKKLIKKSPVVCVRVCLFSFQLAGMHRGKKPSQGNLRQKMNYNEVMKNICWSKWKFGSKFLKIIFAFSTKVDANYGHGWREMMRAKNAHGNRLHLSSRTNTRFVSTNNENKASRQRLRLSIKTSVMYAWHR